MDEFGDDIERFAKFRPALLVWAELQSPAWIRSKLDPGDLVQQTMLEAVRDAGRLRGRVDRELLAYLRRALANNLVDATRKFARTRDDVSPDALAESSRRLVDWLAANDTSPSEQLAREERFARLARGLAGLPDAQRVAIEMRHLQGVKVAEIARVLGRTEGAVTALIHRGVMALRGDLGNLDF